MKRHLKSVCFFIIAAFIIINAAAFASADDNFYLDSAVKNTANYIYKTVKNPQISTIGGDSAVCGLARSGVEIPKSYYENYYTTVEQFVKTNNGILHERKYTEYSRVILALTAIGKNPENIAGYNLITPLGNYDKTIFQGLNGSVWALMALDCGSYTIPENTPIKEQASREMYIKYILDNQSENGGWALSGKENDIDITAMALQALAKYQDNEEVKKATDKALLFISESQNENGGFSGIDGENSESCAQVIIALCELGIPLDDTRFIKNNNTLLDNLMSYSLNDGSFKHTYSVNASDQMATEQCFYALVSAKRLFEGKNSLYNMNDTEKKEENDTNASFGLYGKDSNIKKTDIIFPEKTFDDIHGHKNQSAIEALAKRGIINGKSENLFEPDTTMTRAEFAAIITRGLGLSDKNNNIFNDVNENDWFFKSVNTAYYYGIVNGVSESEFNPYGTITREEAAVMLTRAAKLCGMNTDVELFSARNILAVFTDYVKASNWAITSLAFCCDKGIISDEETELFPKSNASRGDIAQMLFNTLDLSKLF